jgi:serine/threonine protein kinase
MLSEEDLAGATPEGPGTHIGRYRLLQNLGEGGMGAAFLAEQEEPVRRRVALKIIKAGMDSAQVIARFEQERQALALMDHPHIAKVLDAGTTAGGRPFLVMELVKGVPITTYCDQEHLTPQERLELFLPVCPAVQHAHQKGIVHRDLKPSNVLVALYDARPVPKVIDFGVAKAISQKLTERTLFTEVGQVVGTLEYMAPEQAELNNLDIDTRADIYALGAMLYELLTGSTPFTRKQLRNAALTEMLRMIREVEPPKPSTRLSGSDELANIAAKRKLEPKRLTRLVHGDLDWIVMKCLEKERNRRYETANGLAIDVQRYLADEPVLAGPPSAIYRVRKFVRRHRGRVVAASLLLLALIGGIIGTSAGQVEARRQEQLARSERDQKELALLAEVEQKRLAEANERQAAAERDRAIKAEREAKGQAAVSQAVRDFLQHDLLQQANPFLQPDPARQAGAAAETPENPPIKMLLDRAARGLTAQAIGAKFPVQPLVQAGILETVGETYTAVGEYVKAIQHLEQAAGLRRKQLGSDHPYTLFTLHRLAEAYRHAGRTAEAIALFEQVRDGRVSRLGPNHVATLNTLHELANAYGEAERQTEAIALLERVRDGQLAHSERGPDDMDTLRTLHDLAVAYRRVGRLDDAIAVLQRLRPSLQAKLGPEHPFTVGTVRDLAGCYRAVDRTPEAIPLFEQAYNADVAKLGADHPRTLVTLNNLAGSYKEVGRVAEAVALYEKIRDSKLAKLPPDHPSTLVTLHTLAQAYLTAGRSAEAIALWEDLLPKARRKLGVIHASTVLYTAALVRALAKAGQFNHGVDVAAELLAAQRTQLQPGDVRLVAGLALDGLALIRAGKSAEA